MRSNIESTRLQLRIHISCQTTTWRAKSIHVHGQTYNVMYMLASAIANIIHMSAGADPGGVDRVAI